MNKINFLTKRLIRDIKNGGFIIAPRQSGKTTAILHVLNENKDFCCCCHNYISSLNMFNLAIYLFGAKANQIKQRLFHPVNFDSLLSKHYKLIIDEAMWNSLYFQKIHIHCAISSFPMNLIIYNEKGRRLSLKRDRILETDEKFKIFNKEQNLRR